MFFDERINFLSVIRREVFDILRPLEASFDLKAADSGQNQLFEIGGLIVVFEAEHVLARREHMAVKIQNVIGQAARLRTFSAVCRASGQCRRKIASARIAHAQCTRNEKFDARTGHGLTHGADFREGKLTGGNDLRKTKTVKKGCFLGRADVALGGGVNFNIGQTGFKQAEILNNQSIDAGLFSPVGRFESLVNFIVVNERIERHVDAGSILMSKVSNAGKIFK